MLLRSAERTDVERALRNTSFAGWPQDEGDLLELFNATLSLLIVDGKEHSQ